MTFRSTWTVACVAVALLASHSGSAYALEPPFGAQVVHQPSLSLADVDAHAWLIIDAQTGQVLAGHNEVERRAVASTVKTLTALSVLTRHASTETVRIGEEVTGVSGAGVGLRPGDSTTVGVLIDALIARSGNDAAEALAVYVGGSREGFLELMRRDLDALGVHGATLESPSGLDDNNLLSAYDLGVIGAAALRHEVLRDHVARTEVVLPDGTIEPTRNELLLTYPGATGIKTGYTRMAGNALVASAVRDNRELIVVVLAAPDDPARFEIAARLLDTAFANTRPVATRPLVQLREPGGLVDFFDNAASMPQTPELVSVSHTSDVVHDVTANGIGPQELSVRLVVDNSVVTDVTLHRRAHTNTGNVLDVNHTLAHAIGELSWAAVRTVRNPSALR